MTNHQTDPSAEITDVEGLPTKPHGDPLLNEVKPGEDSDVPDAGKGTATSAQA